MFFCIPLALTTAMDENIHDNDSKYRISEYGHATNLSVVIKRCLLRLLQHDERASLCLHVLISNSIC